MSMKLIGKLCSAIWEKKKSFVLFHFVAIYFLAKFYFSEQEDGSF